jgi:hypothetical protein
MRSISRRLLGDDISDRDQEEHRPRPLPATGVPWLADKSEKGIAQPVRCGACVRRPPLLEIYFIAAVPRRGRERERNTGDGGGMETEKAKQQRTGEEIGFGTQSRDAPR